MYFFICVYLIVCCFSVIWALLPEINVMMMMMMMIAQGTPQYAIIFGWAAMNYAINAEILVI